MFSFRFFKSHYLITKRNTSWCVQNVFIYFMLNQNAKNMYWKWEIGRTWIKRYLSTTKRYRAAIETKWTTKTGSSCSPILHPNPDLFHQLSTHKQIGAEDRASSIVQQTCIYIIFNNFERVPQKLASPSIRLCFFPRINFFPIFFAFPICNEFYFSTLICLLFC